ncbi:hypothetical protein LCGC14_1856770 [marine sediment metagenome]|uniref:Uncharacterized protein n=1 Tax=marine sediment metagenome TaxID=412755 RepID=A0A0F9G8N0_9ZZZZ
MATAEERALRALENWACAEQVPLDTFTESARETFVLNVAAEIREAEADGFRRGRQEGLDGVIYYLASNGNPIWRKAAVAAVRNFMEKPNE